MSNHLKSIRACVGLICVALYSHSYAATVYRSVDENGVVSFSDTAPDTPDASVEQLELNVTTPEISDTDRQRLEDMRKTTDLMAADRREREKHRADLRQQALEAQQAKQNVAQDTTSNPEYIRYATGNYGYNHHRPYRPWQHWHKPQIPPPPIAKPPLRPMGKGLKLSPTHRTISVPKR